MGEHGFSNCGSWVWVWGRVPQLRKPALCVTLLVTFGKLMSTISRPLVPVGGLTGLSVQEARELDLHQERFTSPGFLEGDLFL